MLSSIFNPRKRAVSRGFEVAIRYLLHDAENLIPLMKQMYRDKWPGFVDDILNGARPYDPPPPRDPPTWSARPHAGSAR
jgi:hypothetical protein